MQTLMTFLLGLQTEDVPEDQESFSWAVGGVRLLPETSRLSTAASSLPGNSPHVHPPAPFPPPSREVWPWPELGGGLGRESQLGPCMKYTLQVAGPNSELLRPQDSPPRPLGAGCLSAGTQ